MGTGASKSSGPSANNRNVEERRIVLIGKTGAGISTLGNKILREDKFQTNGIQMRSITKHCVDGKRPDGKRVMVLDTPGFNGRKQETENIINELCKCTAITKPGPHAFCLVIRGDEQFTQENYDTLEEICALFGENIYKYMIIVFTHEAGMGQNTTLEACFRELPQEFQDKLSTHGVKKMAIECTDKQKEIDRKVNELFSLIEEIVRQNNDGYYSIEMFKAAEEAFRKRNLKIEQEIQKRVETKMKSLEAEYETKMKSLEAEYETKKKSLEAVCQEKAKMEVNRGNKDSGYGMRDTMTRLGAAAGGLICDAFTGGPVSVAGSLLNKFSS